MEAINRGVPVVSSDAGGAAEIVRDQTDGIIYRRGDAGDLERQVDWALGHPAEMQRMASSALDRAAEFSEARMLGETLELFDDAAAYRA